MPGGCSSGPNGHGSKRVRDGRELSDREARLRARSDRAEQESSETTQNESDNIAAHLMAWCVHAAQPNELKH